MPFTPAVANPAFRHGKLTRVFLNGRDASPFLNSAEVSLSIDTKESSSFGTVSKTYIPGIKESTISIGGMFDGTVGQLDEFMSTLHGQDPTYPCTLFYDAGIAVGRVCRLADVRQTSYDRSSPVDDIVTVSGELQVDGNVTMGYVLNNEQAVNSAVITGAGVDTGAGMASTRGGVMHLHIPVNTRSTAVSVKVQTSTDNSTWVDFLTQSVTAGQTGGICLPQLTGNVSRYIRALITPTAGTGSAVIIVAFGRN